MSAINNSEKGRFLYLSTFPAMFCSLQPGMPAGPPLNPVRLGSMERSGQLLWTWVRGHMDACQGLCQSSLIILFILDLLIYVVYMLFCSQNTEKGIG